MLNSMKRIQLEDTCYNVDDLGRAQSVISKSVEPTKMAC